MTNWADLPPHDRAFGVLALTVLGLLGAAVLFLLVTLFLRFRNARVARIWRELEVSWDPLILEVLAGDAKPDSLLRTVEEKRRLRFLEYLLRYARRLRGGELRMVKRLAEPFLPSLRGVLHARAAERRARAVQILGALGTEAAWETVRKALDDPSPFVSMTAARSLAELGDPEFLPEFLRRLHRYQDWHPAFLAGLLAEPGPEASGPLRSALADTSRPEWSRAVVAQALRQLRDPRAADDAAAVLGEATEPDLLVACLRLIADLGEDRHRGPVLDHLSSPHFPVRSYALRALRALGWKEDLPLFCAALADPSPWVVLEAARGLLAFGEFGLLEELARSAGPGAAAARQVLAE